MDSLCVRAGSTVEFFKIEQEKKKLSQEWKRETLSSTIQKLQFDVKPSEVPETLIWQMNRSNEGWRWRNYFIVF